MNEPQRPTTLPASVQLPRWAPVDPGNRVPVDVGMLRAAREERIANAGVDPGSFARHNVAVVRVRVDGHLRYLSAGDLPRSAGGAHSEAWLLAQVDGLRSQGHAVVVEQLYSERYPCPHHCMPRIRDDWPEAAVFYSVRIPLEPNVPAKAEQLMRAYGLP